MMQKKIFNLNIGSLILFLLLVFFICLTFKRNFIWQDDLKVWEEAVKTSPRSFNNHYCLALTYASRGLYDKAIEEYRKALYFNPLHAPSYTSLGVVYTQVELLDLAEEHLKKAIRCDPSLSEAYNNLGLLYLKKAQIQGAIDNFKQALKINPFFLEAYNNLGLAYKKLGRIEEALIAYQKAIDIEPNFAMAYNNIGVIYAQLQDFKEAAYWFKKATQIQPNMHAARLARDNLMRLARLGYGNIFLIAEHNEAFLIWRRQGLRNRILVHIDGHLDVGKINPVSLAKIKTADNQSEVPGLLANAYELGYQDKPLTIENFIFAAVKEGIVREFWWVVPDGHLDGRAYQGVLEHIMGKNPEEILGIPIHICTFRDLPRFKEDVLLDIDLDFFTTKKGCDQVVLFLPRLWPEDLIKALNKRRIPFSLATISYSMTAGYLPMEFKFLADFLVMGLERLPRDNNYLNIKKAAIGFYARGDYPKAISAYERARTLNADDASNVYGLSLCYEKLGREDISRNYLKKAEDLDKDYRHADLYRAGSYRINRDLLKAERLLKRYIKTEPQPEYLGYANFYLGVIAETKARYTEAIDYYQRAKRFDALDWRTYNNFGNCYQRQGMFDAAIREYKSALEAKPNTAGVYYNLGNCYAKKGLYDLAIEHYQKSLQLDPHFKDALNNLNYAQERMRRDK